MKLTFKNPDTAARFESLVEADRMVHKAGVYSGLLSGIHPGMAAAMVREGSNLLKPLASKKTVSPETVPPSDKLKRWLKQNNESPTE